MRRQKDMTLEDELPRLEGVQYTTEEEQRNSYRRNEEAEPQEKWCSVVDVSGDESKIWCCKEQCCIGAWNVRSMNQGKLDMVKQLVRININILGISEPRWMGMGTFTSDDHYIYYCGQEFHRRNGIGLITDKKVQNAVLEYNLKNDRKILVSFQGKSFNITATQCLFQCLPPMPKKLKLISSMKT